MYLFIFGVSVLLAMQTSSIHNNFTYLSYTNNLRFYYILWVIILSCFLLYKVLLLFKRYSVLNIKLYFLIYTSYFSMIIGAMLPYRIEANDLFSSLHILLSSLGCLLLFVILKVLLHQIQFHDFIKYQKIDMYLNWFISSFVMLAILFGSINIIVEEYFLFIILFHLYLIEKKEE